MSTSTESHVVEAILRARDEGMTKALDAAGGSAQTLGGKVKNLIGKGAALQIGMGLVQKGMGAINSHMDAAIRRVDTMRNFVPVMESLGFSSDDASKSIKQLGDGIEGLPTTLDEIVSNTQMLTASLGDLGKGTKTAVALNDMFLAGGQGAEAASRALTQYNQMLAKGKVDQQSWNTLVEVAPGQLNQLAKSMLGAGKGQRDLYAALQKGTITMDDFNDAIIKLDAEGGEGFASFKDQALAATGGIGTAMKNVGSAITKGVANCIMAFDDLLANTPVKSISNVFAMLKSGINSTFTEIQDTISKVDIKGVVAAATPYYNAFKTAASAVGTVLKTVGGFAAEHAGQIVKLAGAAATLLAIWKGYTVITTVAASIASFTNTSKMLATNVLPKLIPTMMATGAAEAEAGAGAAAAAPSMLELGVAALMIGAGIAVAAGGMYILAQAAIKLASAGAPAAAAMLGMVGAIAALAAGAALLGPALTAGSIGFIAFGAGVLMAGAGMALVATGAAKLAAAMPIVASSAGVAAKGVAKLAPALLALGASAATASPGLLAVGASFKVASSGVKSFKGGATSAASAMTQLGAGITRAANAIKTGMTQAVSNVKTALSSMNSSMSSAASKAYSNGANIARGFAKGINSQMGSVTAAVNKMVNEADKATRAKAKIHSPSKLFAKLGGYVGEGFALGIEGMNGAVAKASSNMVSVPKVAAPGVTGGGQLNDLYSYGSGSNEAVFYLDGREFARATSESMQSAIARRTTISNRKAGVVGV